MKRLFSSFFFSILIASCLVPLTALAWELPLLTEKQGTFLFLSRTDYTGYNCGFKISEISTNLQRISSVVDTIRKNPVLSELKGFEGRARIYNVECTDSGRYGIPSRISFEFCSWYLNKNGKETRGIVEPPNWVLVINKLKPTTGWEFSANIFPFRGDLFIVSHKKETVESGIDVYDGECYVIYNPDRPPYWLPVTVNEAFDRLRDSWKNYPDKIAAKEMMKIIESEYAAIPEADKEKPAHVGGGGLISQIGPDINSPQIMRVNPEYWNRNLPKSSIQFIYFRSSPNKEYFRKLKEESLQNNSTSYNLYRFEESFDLNSIRSLVPLIEK